MQVTARRRIWGWFFYDWAAQPYSTLLLTFIFAPYVKDLMGDGTAAQTVWGLGVGVAGVIIAFSAPFLGAMADTGGNRVRWIWVFSLCYVVGAAGLWFAAPGDFNLYTTMALFALGLIGLEFTTIFTNAMLPDLGTREEIARISGNGWAFGYVGGLLALLLVLGFLQEDPTTGRTMLGFAPPFGLDPEAREGTRAVGPFTALWYVVFMIPFFMFVRDPRRGPVRRGMVRAALSRLGGTLRNLPRTPSLFAYLASSMCYRDALNGMYTFGGIYAAGMLGWTSTDIGIFGILAITTGAFAAWAGGYADAYFGPKPVIRAMIIVLTLVAIALVSVSRESVLGIAVAPESNMPDTTFYVIGCLIGSAGGVLASASRTMMVRQAREGHMTEAFGLYALAGKATAFLAPLLISLATWGSSSQAVGVSPLIVLFLLGLVLLVWVKPEGEAGA